MVVTTVAAGVYVHREKPSYKATASVQLASTAANGGGGGAATTGVNTSPALVTSQQVARLLPKDPPVSGSISSAMDTTTNVLTLTGKAPTAAAAQATANGYAAAYLAYLQQEVQAQLRGLQGQLTKAQAAITKIQNEIKGQAPSTTPALLQALLTSAITNYTTIQSQLSQLQAAQAPAELGQLAQLGTPSGSSKAKVLALAVLIGLIAGAGIALIREQLDTRLRDPLDLAGITDAPLLAELPFDRDSAKSRDGLSVVDRPRAPFSESIRELRTAIQVLVDTIACPVLVVTSAEPADGKTMVTANLAASWALSGKHTIVVSGDLRRPHIEQLLGTLPGAGGVATIVQAARAGGTGGEPRGTAPSGGRPVSWDVEQVTKGPAKSVPLENGSARRQVTKYLLGTEMAGLAVLPSGPSPEDPADVLATAEIGIMVARLREVADVVLIDTPPVLAVADATILGTYADGVVVVAMSEKTTHEVLEQTIRRMAAAQVNVLGIALNKSRHAASHSYPEYYANAPAERVAPAEPLVSPAPPLTSPRPRRNRSAQSRSRRPRG